MQILSYQKARSQSCDLAYTILLAMGGTDNDIEQKYASNLDDLLYAILKFSNKSSEQLAEGATYYDAKAGTVLIAIFFDGGAAANIGVGYSAITNEIFDIGVLPLNGVLPFNGVVRCKVDTRIYLNGVQPDTITTIYKL